LSAATIPNEGDCVSAVHPASVGLHGGSCVAGAPLRRAAAVELAASLAALLLACGMLVACSPRFDWRDVAVADSALVAEMPCRPGRFQREFVVAGTSLKWFMLACEADGVTFGVATAEVGDARRVEAVLQALAADAVAGIRSTQTRVGALSIQGATPFVGNVDMRLTGARPDGSVVEEAVRLFGRGTRVFQASAIAARLPVSVLQPFQDGLRFDLAKKEADTI
jgi:hypothetical protein